MADEVVAPETLEMQLNREFARRDALHETQIHQLRQEFEQRTQQILQQQNQPAQTQESQTHQLARASGSGKFIAPDFYGHGRDGKIDGKEGPREWLRSFDGAIQLYEAQGNGVMTETVKKLQLRQHLKGSAGTWFESYEDKYKDWKEFVVAFSAYYGLENLQIKLRLEITKLKQGKDEEIRQYNVKYQQCNQQIKKREVADQIFFYIQGLCAGARQHLYVTYPFSTWESLDTVMEAALSYSVAGSNAIPHPGGAHHNPNTDVEMNVAYPSKGPKRNQYKWTQEEWRRIQDERRCRNCGDLGHMKSQCGAGNDVKLLVHEMPAAELTCLRPVSSQFNHASMAPEPTWSRVVRIDEVPRVKNLPRVRFETKRVDVSNDRTVYPVSSSSMYPNDDDRVIREPSEDEVNYEEETDVDEEGTVVHNSMSLDSMDKPFVLIDNDKCYLWSAVSFQAMRVDSEKCSNVPNAHHQLMRIKVELDGIGAYALIDSGASHRFVKGSWLRANGIVRPIQRSRQRVKQANGIFETLGVIRLRLKIQGRVDEAWYLVLPDGGGHDIVLGMSWLSAHNPTIDWVECAISFDDAGSVNHRVSLQAQQVLNDVEVESIRMSPREFKRSLEADAQLFVIEPAMPLSNTTATLNHMGAEDRSKCEDSRRLRRVVNEYASHIVDDIPGVAPDSNGLPRHHIEWKGDKPPSRPLIRLSYKELDHLKEKLNEFLAKKWIRPSTSPFGAPVLLVSKKEAGKLRMCIDYRQLNAGTVVNQYPLPHTDELFNRLRGATVFSKIDLHSGFYQLLMAEEDIHKTAFRTRYGHYEWRVMPMGLAGAPATFQTVMNGLFKELLDVCVIVFLDDILVYSGDMAAHVGDVESVLSILKGNGLYAARKKCEFGVDRIEFLGHIVTPDGLSCDPHKIDAVKDWPVPRTMGELRGFLGLSGYYRRFINGYSKKAYHLSSLIRHSADKRSVLRWGPEQAEAFANLKKALCSAPVLALANPSETFYIFFDASGNNSVGGVLAQNQSDGLLHPVSFESKQLLPAQTRYPTHEQELFAFIHCLQKWRYFLDAKPFVVYTDSYATSFIQTQGTLSKRQARWLDTLQGHSFTIKHIPRGQNVVADALSQRPINVTSIRYQSSVDMHERPGEDLDVEMQVMSVASISNGFLGRIVKGYAQDPACARIIKDLETGEDPGLPYHLEDKLLYLRDNGGQRLRVPASKGNKLWNDILYQCHDSACLGGHFSAAKTLAKVRQYYYWPSLPSFVDKYVASCDSCQRNKSLVGKQPGKLHPLPVPDRRWGEVTMDFAVMPTDKNGDDMCIIFVERLSKRAHLVSCKSTLDARGLALIFMRTIYAQHGLPDIVYSDRDSLITSKFWQALWLILGTKLRLTTARHQQADGQSERMVRILKDMLRNYVNHHQDDWTDWLPSVEFAYNSTSHSSVGASPFFTDLGWTPHAAGVPEATEKIQCPASLSFAEHLHHVLGLAQDNIRSAVERQKVQYDKSRIHREFAVGDLVLLNADGITIDARRGLPRSLRPKYIGPFPITERIGRLVYALDMSSVQTKVHNQFHVSVLKPYVGASDGRALAKPPPVIPDTDIYEVDSILRQRTWRNVKQYLVRWRGYGDDDATWEPATALKNAKDAIRDFHGRAK